MPAKVGVWFTGGITAIQVSGWVPPEWNKRFYKAGWRWMRGSYIKRGLTTEVEKEARELVEEYNNRFKDAA